MPESEAIKLLSARTVFEGPVADIQMATYQRPDGSEVDRQVVQHKGAVGILAYDDSFVYLVRQPREAVLEPALLEIPAGLLDVDGESPLEAAKRELVEEVGLEAGDWSEMQAIYPSPGFINEKITLFVATELKDVGAKPDGDEMIEIVRLPLARLEATIGHVRDAKTLVALLMLRSKLSTSDLLFP